MSKAFVKDTDEQDAPDETTEVSPPALGKNYITPAGFKRLQEEFKDLMYRERPEVTRVVAWAAGNGDRSENADYTYGKRRLREIDRRLRFLSRQIENAEIVDPAAIQSDQVLFGATVTIINDNGAEKTYAIVGIDEVDISQGRISWASPLAVALHKMRVGDVVTVQAPQGTQEVELIKIQYLKIGE